MPQIAGSESCRNPGPGATGIQLQPDFLGRRPQEHRRHIESALAHLQVHLRDSPTEWRKHDKDGFKINHMRLKLPLHRARSHSKLNQKAPKLLLFFASCP